MHPDDVFVWPDGMWCFRDELPDFSHKSDDYRVINAGTDDWEEFLDEHYEGEPNE